MIEVVYTGLCWVLKDDLSKTQIEKIKSSYTHINPANPEVLFSTYLELHGKIGIPLGDKAKIESILGTVKVIDKRISPRFATQKTSKLPLRDYQEEAMEEITQYVSSGGTEFNLSGKPRSR